MKPDVYIRLYPGDWLKDTMHLDATCTGAYFLLILAHRGRPGLPDNDTTLRTIARVDQCDWMRVKATIGEFFEKRAGMWVNKRSVEDWERDSADYREACERTKKATAARVGNVTSNVTCNVTSHVTATQSESESESESKPIESISGEPSVEFPPGFPKTAEQAKVHAGFVCCDPGFAETTWQIAAGRGGKDAKGIAITSFRHHLAAAWSIKRGNDAEKAATKSPTQQAGKRPLSLMDLRTILETKKSQKADLRAKHYSDTAMGGSWDNDAAKQEYFKLHKDIKDLQGRISNYEKCS